MSQNFKSTNYGSNMFDLLCQSLNQHAASMLNKPIRLCSYSHICTTVQLFQNFFDGIKASFLTPSS